MMNQRLHVMSQPHRGRRPRRVALAIAPVMEALEIRSVMSAAIAAALGTSQEPGTDQTLPDRAALPIAATPSAAMQGRGAVAPWSFQDAGRATQPPQGPGWGVDVVLIDTSLADEAVLEWAVRPGAVGFLYDGRTDSANEVLSRVTHWVEAGGATINSLSLLAHAAPGRFEVGDQWVSDATLADTAPAWRELGRALAPGGEINLFGCALVAPGGGGQALIDDLASMTGANVFASDNLTGRGGDWSLEDASRGADATHAGAWRRALDLSTLSSWPGTLNATAPTSADRSLLFDSVNSIVVVPDSPSLRVTSAVTMEASVLLKGTTGSNEVILNKEGEYEFALAADGKIKWAVANTSPGWYWTETAYSLPLNQWTRLAVTYDGAAVNTYANGVLVDSQVANGPIGDFYPALNNLTIGGRQNSTSQRFLGTIDNVRVWNVALSAAQVAATDGQPLTGAEPGLIGDWRFDEPPGTVAALDSSSFGNNGLLGGGNAANLPVRELSVALNQGTSVFDTAPAALSDATDPNGLPLSAVLVGAPAHAASFQLYPDGSFAYTPDPAFSGLDQFTFQASNGASTSPVGVFYLVVNHVNQPPVNALPPNQITYQNAPLILSTARGNVVAISDSDAGSGALRVTLNATNGTISLARTSGLTFSSGTGGGDARETFTGTRAAINAALDGLSFLPTAGYTGPADLQISTNDQGNTGLGGPRTTTSDLGIAVVPVPTTPVVTTPTHTISAPPPTTNSAPIVLGPLLNGNGGSVLPVLPRAASSSATVNAARRDQAGLEGGSSAAAAVGKSLSGVLKPRAGPALATDSNSEDGAAVSAPVNSVPALTVALAQASFGREGSNAVAAMARIGSATAVSLAGALGDLGRADSPALWNELDQMASGITDGVQAKVITVAVATGMAVSVGYVAWSIRAGYFLAALLAATPVWKQLDPLAVLEASNGRSRRRDGDEGEATESLLALLERRRTTTNDPGRLRLTPSGA